MYELVHKRLFEFESVASCYGALSPNGTWLGLKGDGMLIPVHLESCRTLPAIFCLKEGARSLSDDGHLFATLDNGKLYLMSSSGLEAVAQLSPAKDYDREGVYNGPLWYESVSFLPGCGHIIATVNLEGKGSILLLEGSTLEVLDRIEKDHIWSELSLSVHSNGIVAINEMCGDTPLGVCFYREASGKLKTLPNFFDPMSRQFPDYERFDLFGFSADDCKFAGIDGYTLWEMDWNRWRVVTDVSVYEGDHVNHDQSLLGSQACYLGENIAIASCKSMTDHYTKLRFYSPEKESFVAELNLPDEAKTKYLCLYPNGYLTTMQYAEAVDLWQIVPIF